MINKVELGSVNSKNGIPQIKKRGDNTSFTGVGNILLKGIQKCEEYPMINVAVLDLSTAILPRTFFETFIGSKQKDENGEETKRKLNVLGGFEAFRREFSGLLINCLIPSFIVIGVAKLLQKPIMGMFNKSNLAKSWANSDTVDQVGKYYNAAEGATKQERTYNALKSMINDMEGVDGDIDKGGLKKFKDIFAEDAEFDSKLRQFAQDVSEKELKHKKIQEFYEYVVGKTGISENIRFANQAKSKVGEGKINNGFFSSNLKHLFESTADILHGASTEEISLKPQEFSKYLSHIKKLVNAKSLAGLGIIIPLAISAQPINRWITHNIAGKKGAPIYNDDEERTLNPHEKKKLVAEKFVAVPLMWAVAGLSMLLDRPSLKMFQFKNIFPTMDQARIISAATFSSRIAASEDSNELQENTIRDIATFSSFYFLGDYAAKAIATLLEKKNKYGIKLTNKLKNPPAGATLTQKFWNWAKHTKMKSTDELSAIADETLRTKAKNMRAWCQVGNLAFSLLSLGVFIPLYTRTQTNKKKEVEAQKAAMRLKENLSAEKFSQNLIKEQSPTFKSFINNNK